MRTAEFDYQLPPELIAQTPAPKRDESRLLVLHRTHGRTEHRAFRDLPAFLRPGDVLVLNNSRVIPARLRGCNCRSGGRFEILLLEENAPNDWWAMLRPAKRARVGSQIAILCGNRRETFPQPAVIATVMDVNDEGYRRLCFTGTADISRVLDLIGEVPLPHYIRRGTDGPEAPGRLEQPATQAGDRVLETGTATVDLIEACDDRERYQTVFAESAGSVAAPTAGLHFTSELLEAVRSRGVQVCFLTLHVGPGTFAPVKSESVTGHKMHEERYELSEASAQVVNRAKAGGRRVVAVGTTTVRVLESVAAKHQGRLVAEAGRTRIFVYPPCDFRIVDALLTNFHLPCSTLLMLVSAFATPGETRGSELILSTYAEAIHRRYRFFSYGDAMLLL